jgi:hypothetical protein
MSIRFSKEKRTKGTSPRRTKGTKEKKPHVKNRFPAPYSRGFDLIQSKNFMKVVPAMTLWRVDLMVLRSFKKNQLYFARISF